jgi:uncharacterized protein
MIHPWTEVRLVSAEIGLGIFATRDIPKGSITWVRDPFDQVFTPAKVRTFDAAHQRILDHFGYRDGRGETVLCWDHARYMNHSCASSNLSPGWDLEVAVRDVPAGTEMTDDYGGLGLERPFDCLCGAPECRKRLMPDDHLRMAPVWDRALVDAIAQLKRVDQPLWDFVREKAEIESALRGERAIPSTLVHYPESGSAAHGASGSGRSQP